MSYRMPISLCALVLIVSFVNATGQCQTSDDEEFICKHQFDLVKVNCERVDDYAVGRVFRSPIYHFMVSVKEGYGQSPFWGTLVAARVGDTLVPIPQPREGVNADLLAMFSPDFKLSDGDAAEVLQRALDVVFPVASDSVWSEKFQHDGNQWKFIRGRSFGPPGQGQFVVSTDDQGKITELRYSRMLATGPIMNR